MIAEPPSLAGAVNATVACALPAVAVPMVGAPGTPWGVTLFEGAEAAPVPTELVALTVNVYDVPFVRPVTVQGDVAHVPVCPPEDVAVYERIVAPPLLPGGVKLTVACALPAVALPIVGASGTVAGVTLLEAADAGPVPIAFVAVTVNVYAVPFARPVTVQGEVAHVPVCPPDEVAVYEVIAEPPSLAGAVKLTVAWPLPAVAVPIVGAPGALRTRTLLDAADAALEPTEFTATTVKVYDVPPARPVTLIDVHGALQNPVTPPGEDVAT
jgi:hypothetical protein